MGFQILETGHDVFKRTYARIKPDGTRESWEDTVERVVEGNAALAPVPVSEYEKSRLRDLIYRQAIMPAGRHLYMTGVEGRQFLSNCHVAGWGDNLSEHFTFTFLRLMEGGGVGGNYSQHLLGGYHVPNIVRVHIYCAKSHPDYDSIKGYLSTEDISAIAIHELEDSREGWAHALGVTIDAATDWNPRSAVGFHVETCKDTGTNIVHVGFDVSDIRPAGSEIKSFGGTAAGPLPLVKMLHSVKRILDDMWLNGVNGPSCMELDHAIAEAVIAGNVRRSARMSLMRWDDPWINWFLTCKTDASMHWSTNISVEIDDEFISYIQDNSSPESESDIARRSLAREVFDAITRGMLKNGEPGFWSSSLANKGEVRELMGVNPCGEIPLEAWEDCNLGHVNLAYFVTADGLVDWNGLAEAHRLMARFLIRATYSDKTDPRQRDVVDRNRRIGVGHMGYQWFVNKQGIKYSESWEDRFGLADALRVMAGCVRLAAAEYAFQLRIPSPIKVTTVAPTGTISKMSGVSSGVQPIYARHFIHRVRYSSIDPDQIKMVDDLMARGYTVVGDIYSENTVVVEIPSMDPLMNAVSDVSVVEDASEVHPYDAMKVQEMYQTYYADNGVSYTVNIPDGSMDEKNLRSLLKEFMPKLKGTTIMVDGSRPLAPYERITEEEYAAAIESCEAIALAVDQGCANGACPVR